MNIYCKILYIHIHFVLTGFGHHKNIKCWYLINLYDIKAKSGVSGVLRHILIKPLESLCEF